MAGTPKTNKKTPKGGGKGSKKGKGSKGKKGKVKLNFAAVELEALELIGQIGVGAGEAHRGFQRLDPKLQLAQRALEVQGRHQRSRRTSKTLTGWARPFGEMGSSSSTSNTSCTSSSEIHPREKEHSAPLIVTSGALCCLTRCSFAQFTRSVSILKLR